MKTYTMTLHCTDNAGSTLQAYALQQFLIKNNIENELIDYRPQYMFKYGNPFKRILKEVLYAREMKSKDKKNRMFENRYLRKTQMVYREYRDLLKCPFICDALIVGSDQVWNMEFKCGQDDAFYLKFAPNNVKKIAYAVSIGKADVPTEELDFIAERIFDFNEISVRENSSKVALEKRGVKNVAYVCDPTLLLNKEEYLKIETIRITGEYILVYLVQPSELLDFLIEKIRNLYNCKVVLIYGIRDNCKCDIHLRDVSPDEFVGLIHNAKFVIASSFHAVMFSHIFEKNFAIVLPKRNQARIEQFLLVSHLQSRIVYTVEDVNNLEPEIDYSEVRCYLDRFRTYSQKYLLHVLTE